MKNKLKILMLILIASLGSISCQQEEVSVDNVENLDFVYDYFNDRSTYSSAKPKQIGFTLCSLDAANDCSTSSGNSMASAGVTVYQSGGQYYATRSVTYGDGSVFYSTIHLPDLHCATSMCESFEAQLICM